MTITPEDLAELRTLVEQLQTQHNDYTAHPIFLVQKRVEVAGFSTEWTDDILWIDADGDAVNAEEHAQLETGYEESYEEPEGFTRIGVKAHWETVQTFLTRRAAEQYLESNAHRLGEGARIYTDSAYRNHEIQLLQRTLPWLVQVAEKEVVGA